MEEHQIARAGVGRKFQIPSIFRELTVAQNIAYGLEMEKLARREIKGRVAERGEGVDRGGWMPDPGDTAPDHHRDQCG